MSTLKVAGIRGTGASADAITLHASDGTCTAKITNSLSNRRLNINGAMTVAQRATSVNLSGSGSSQNAYRVTDRFFCQNRSDANWTYSQESDGPPGFAKSFKALCTSADSSVAANVFEMFSYKFEGQDLQHLKKGTSDAESLTISFWVKSNKTGTYIFEAHDLDNSRQISKSYTISSASTWEKKTINIAGDTTGALDNDNDVSLQVYWWVAAGSDKSSGTLNTSWGSITQANRAAGQVQLTDTTNNFWQITGIQVEIDNGSGVATDFEHRSYADELRRCQRYCWMVENNTTVESSAFGIGYCKSTTTARWFPLFPVEMRAAPTLTPTGVFRVHDGSAVNVITVGSSGSVTAANNQSRHSTNVVFSEGTYTTGSAFVQGRGCQIYGNGTDAAKLIFDAEI